MSVVSKCPFGNLAFANCMPRGTHGEPPQGLIGPVEYAYCSHDISILCTCSPYLEWEKEPITEEQYYEPGHDYPDYLAKRFGKLATNKASRILREIEKERDAEDGDTK